MPKDLDFRLKELRRCLFNKPTIQFEVGDWVQYGHIDHTEIIEVVDGGRIYKIRKTGKRQHYHKKVAFDEIDYVAWTDLEPYRAAADDDLIEQFYKRDRLQLQTYQTDMRSLFNRYFHFGVDMSPDYQRGNVWRPADDVALIHSIFQNIDIGRFVFVKLPFLSGDLPLYEILDGKQRITALVNFKEGRFQYRQKSYFDLCRRDQSHFNNYTISMADVNNISIVDKYKYFLKLNIGGKQHSKKHLEKVQRMLEEQG